MRALQIVGAIAPRRSVGVAIKRRSPRLLPLCVLEHDVEALGIVDQAEPTPAARPAPRPSNSRSKATSL
jgi:hypothetical protein